MKVLVFGSNGFIGRNVCKELEKNHEVIRSTHESVADNNIVQVDLLSPDSINAALQKVNPQVIVNCAGFVGVGTGVDLNIQFTKNILEQITQVGGVEKVIISGSAGEYGRVSPDNIPVNENAPLNADAGYGLSKLKEEQFALDYGKKNNINVVVLRMFNPIGEGMANRFLLTNLMQQVEECRSGVRDTIELSRLDTKRDYISVKDIASAFGVVIDGKPKENVYNVGSGRSTTNGELLELILKNSKLDVRPKIKETSNDVEALVAIQADISRISGELGWQPVYNIEETVREIRLT